MIVIVTFPMVKRLQINAALFRCVALLSTYLTKKKDKFVLILVKSVCVVELEVALAQQTVVGL